MRPLTHLSSLAVMTGLAASLVAAPCNTAPTVAAQSVAITAGELAIVDVLADASDPDGQALTLSLASDTCPPQITATVDPTQTLTISAARPAPDCEIRYRVSDGAGGIVTSHVAVSVVVPSLIFSDGFELGSTAAWDRP